MLYSVVHCNMTHRVQVASKKKGSTLFTKTDWVKGLVSKTNGHLGNETHEMKPTNSLPN